MHVSRQQVSNLNFLLFLDLRGKHWRQGKYLAITEYSSSLAFFRRFMLMIICMIILPDCSCYFCCTLDFRLTHKVVVTFSLVWKSIFYQTETPAGQLLSQSFVCLFVKVLAKFAPFSDLFLCAKICTPLPAGGEPEHLMSNCALRPEHYGQLGLRLEQLKRRSAEPEFRKLTCRN